jgi:hypothetical protein
VCYWVAQPPTFSANSLPGPVSGKGLQALLEHPCQGIQRVEGDPDHPAAPPPDDARRWRPFLQQMHQAIAIEAPPCGEVPVLEFAVECRQLRCSAPVTACNAGSAPVTACNAGSAPKARGCGPPHAALAQKLRTPYTEHAGR